MLTYLIVFALSLLAIFFGSEQLERGKKIPGRIIIAVGIAVPCFLAATRALSIGTDTKGYVSGLFEIARQTDDLSEYINFVNSEYGISDYAYVIVNYVVAHVFGNFNILLFVLELLTIFPVYLALKNNKKKSLQLLFGFALFFLFEYNVSFNMVRQCIALSFVILALKQLDDKKYWCSLLCVLLAIGFHTTAVVAILLFPAYYLFKKLKGKGREILKLAIYGLLVMFVLFFENIVLLLYDTGIYTHGLAFIQRYSISFDFGFIGVITYAFALCVYLAWSRTNKSIENHDFNKFLGIGSIILLSLGWRITYMERISFYLFYPFLLYTIPKAITEKSKNKRAKRYMLMLLTYFAIYWVIGFAVLKLHETVPYKFMFSEVVLS